VSQRGSIFGGGFFIQNSRRLRCRKRKPTATAARSGSSFAIANGPLFEWKKSRLQN
jgi:hypothetical protein